MPTYARDYSQACVYALRPKDAPVDAPCYIGSTANLHARLNAHRAGVKSNTRRFDNALYRSIRSLGGWDAWECSVLEFFPCATAEQLHLAERRWFDLLQPSLNKHRPGAFFSSDKRERNAALVKRWFLNHPGYYKAWNSKARRTP